MGRLRWADEGAGRWDLDLETPVTMEGTARAVPGDPLPLGISRGVRITRPKQLNFMHRFMSSPLVPSFAGDPDKGGRGLLLHHAYTFLRPEKWFTTVLQQIDTQKILPLLKEFSKDHLKQISWPKTIFRHFLDIFSWGLGFEYMADEDSSFLVEMYNVKKGNRGKAIFHQKFPQHSLTLEAAWPGLFVDQNGTYWDVPLSLAVDLGSVSSSTGLSYHLCLQHNSGQPTCFGGNQTTEVPPSLLPGLCARAAISIKENLNIWRKKEGKLRMVLPYDAFLSEPHISASGVIGAVASASIGDCSARFSIEDGSDKWKAFRLCKRKHNSAFFADLFASVSCTAQHGNFQRLVLDLTRLSARVDFPSGSAFLSGVSRLAQDLHNSQQPNLDALRAVCPELSVSLQQQIVGPFSFRVDSRILLDPKDRYQVARVDESIFAIDWALKVLGSAKATAWYSPKRQEGMIELRFYEF